MTRNKILDDYKKPTIQSFFLDDQIQITYNKEFWIESYLETCIIAQSDVSKQQQYDK